MIEKLLKFIDPFLSYIDSGKLFRKPFSWLYVLMAVVNALIPFYAIYKVIDTGILSYGGGKVIFAFFLVWLFLVAACWVGVQIWWNRKDKVLETSAEGSEFPITPVISHCIQTFGEWIGCFIAIFGFGISLIGPIFLGEATSFLPMMNYGFLGIILFPIFGFLYIVFMRFIAEMFRALASIANNTKK